MHFHNKSAATADAINTQNIKTAQKIVIINNDKTIKKIIWNRQKEMFEQFTSLIF